MRNQGRDETIGPTAARDDLVCDSRQRPPGGKGEISEFALYDPTPLGS
jgi:hypothetical protein